MKIVERGSKTLFYANFVNRDGSAATITSGPTITIMSVASSPETILSETNMINLTGSIYYYEHYFNPKSNKKSYEVIYKATYSDGTNVIGTEEFRVSDTGFYKAPTSGSVRVAKDSIWSKAEKDKLILTVSSLIKVVSDLKQNNSIKDELEESISKIISIVSNNNSIDLDFTDIKLKLSELQTNIIKELNSIKQSDLIELNNNINNTLVKLNEVESLFIKSIPDEKLEEIKNE